MKSAKVISSNSHIDYVARVYDESTGPDDLEFATFVRFSVGDTQIVGVIYDSKLVDPQLRAFGPRLRGRTGLGELQHDSLNEPGVLVGIVILGYITDEGEVVHGVPPSVIPHGCELNRMTDDEIVSFHRGAGGRLKLHYYSQLIANTGLLAAPLMESIISRLLPTCSDSEKKRLGVLNQTLKWQRTMGSVR